MDNSQKSFLVYDDDCGFCMNSIKRFKKILGEEIDYIGRSEFKAAAYGLEASDLEKSIQYVDFNPISGKYEIYSGARAIYGALANNPFYSLPLTLYKHIPPFAFISNIVYSWIAKNRKKLGNSCTVSKPKI